MSEYIYRDNGAFGLRESTGEEVVRCRDCRYYEREVFTFGERKEYHWCNRDWNGEPVLSAVEPDGFCAWGERRDA